MSRTNVAFAGLEAKAECREISRVEGMLTYQRVLEYVRAEPFRPFRIHMASGRTFDIRHPEMIKVLKSYLLIFRSDKEGQEVPDEFDTVSLLLTESISHLESPVH